MTSMYAHIRDVSDHNESLQNFVEATVTRLEEMQTSFERPGMVLGKIQSGKTKGFLGIIARSFDRGFDIALVFTKGTRTLAKQTVRRINVEYKELIENELVSVYDIMEVPDKLTRSEQKRKIIIVCKKEKRNLMRVQEFLSNYEGFTKKRMLFVDDEADMTSIRFIRKQGQPNLEQGTISQQIDDLRKLVPSNAYLQVTATPYALYLQPEEYSTSERDRFYFLPKRPSFTQLLPTHDAYVGGDDYFGSFGDQDPRHFLYVNVPDEEQDALRSADGRAVREGRIWSSRNIVVLRQAVLTFLVAVTIRRWQQKELGSKLAKFSMVMHNDTQRAAHNWQWHTVERLKTAFEEAAGSDDPKLIAAFEAAFEDLGRSISANGGRMPSRDHSYAMLKELILDGELNVQRVNSDSQLEALLDPDTAELKLRTQANIFIGGSILDRGITVRRLIAFYYGRNPRRMQADTVLQHSRMYGAREMQDLAVTRFYTSTRVYERLGQIHRMETMLRAAIEKEGPDVRVVFISKDAQQRIIPCAPSKIAMSDVVSLGPAEFYPPTGFDTIDTPDSRSAMAELDDELMKLAPNENRLTEIPLRQAMAYIDTAWRSMDRRKSDKFDWEAIRGLLKYYGEEAGSGNVDLLVETNRKLSRGGSGDKSGLSIVGGAKVRSLLQSNTRRNVALVMLRQEGTKALGWSGGRPFWWPVLAAPSHAEPCVFANARPAD